MNTKQLLLLLGVTCIACVALYVYRATIYVPQVPTPATEIPLEDTTVHSDRMTYVNASNDMIRVELPYPGAVTGKEFGIIGEARGPWFFEGSFPVEVLDKDGNVLVQGVGTALGEWMTEEFVKFVSEVTVPESYIGPATVVLKKENPSGEPERDASLSFPIVVEY